MKFSTNSKVTVLESVTRDDKATIKRIAEAVRSSGIVLPKIDHLDCNVHVQTPSGLRPLGGVINDLIAEHGKLFEHPDLVSTSKNRTVELFGLSALHVLNCVEKSKSLESVSIIESKDVLSEVLAAYSAPDADLDSLCDMLLDEIDSSFVNQDSRCHELDLRVALDLGSIVYQKYATVLDDHTFRLVTSAVESRIYHVFNDTDYVDESCGLPLHPPLESDSVIEGLQVIVVPNDLDTPKHIQFLIDELSCTHRQVADATLYFVNPAPTQKQRDLLTSIYRAASMRVGENSHALSFGLLGQNLDEFRSCSFHSAPALDREVYENALDEDVASDHFDSVTAFDALYLQASSFVISTAFTLTRKQSELSMPNICAVLSWIASDL